MDHSQMQSYPYRDILDRLERLSVFNIAAVARYEAMASLDIYSWEDRVLISFGRNPIDLSHILTLSIPLLANIRSGYELQRRIFGLDANKVRRHS
jgi:hypothetical protein